MAYTLTNEEKADIIASRLKSLERSKYDFQLSIDEENSLVSPSLTIIASHQESINNINLKIAVLTAKLEELS